MDETTLDAVRLNHDVSSFHIYVFCMCACACVRVSDDRNVAAGYPKVNHSHQKNNNEQPEKQTNKNSLVKSAFPRLRLRFRLRRRLPWNTLFCIFTMMSSEATTKAASQIEILLKPSDVNTEEEYYKKLIRRGIEEFNYETFSNVCVQRNHHNVTTGVINDVAMNTINATDCTHVREGVVSGKNRGKGLYATRDFAVGDRVLIEPPLVAMQHERNRNDAIVCSFCFRYVGSIEKQIGQRLFQQFSSTHEMQEQQQNEQLMTATPNNTAAEEAARRSSDLEILNSMASVGEPKLPLADEHFPLPMEHRCVGGCYREVFCSNECAQNAWNSHERAMCIGNNNGDQEEHAKIRAAIMHQFIEHAKDTNDIFILAAKVVAMVTENASLALSDTNNNMTFLEALERAWEPFSRVQKAIWWDIVAIPSDVEEKDEESFRQQLIQVASGSLELLCKAWPDRAQAFPGLFSLPVWGAIVGMFELNNLELVVESPVENYFLTVDGLADEKQKMAILPQTQPFLDALDVNYDIPCLGTALFALQSNCNHDCDPNCHPFKDETDINGSCVLVARKPIQKGDELTISYLEDDQLDWSRRQDALSDYGFVCKCARCESEVSQTRGRHHSKMKI